MHLPHCSIANYSLSQMRDEPYVPDITGQRFSPEIKRLTTMFLTHVVSIYRQWRRYNNALRELNRLGDRELADIGINRGDIPRVAWESSESI